jgi:hypothetical protein
VTVAPTARSAKTEPGRPGRIPALTSLFGFAQFDFAGPLPLADGRYLARNGPAEEESVLVVQTLGTVPAARRRRRTRAVEAGAPPTSVPLARVTAIRAFAPFSDAAEASRWLKEAATAEDTTDILLADGIGLLNQALHAQAVTAGDPRSQQDLAAERAVAVRIGFGSGEEIAAGRFSEAREVDLGDADSRRRQRQAELRPQERVAALLGGRERLDACETMLLRGRADLDAGREREAALQLRVGLEALLVELDGAISDPAHSEDMATLQGRRAEAGSTANAALRGDLDAHQAAVVRELLEICERVLRRRRVLRG